MLLSSYKQERSGECHSHGQHVVLTQTASTNRQRQPHNPATGMDTTGGWTGMFSAKDTDGRITSWAGSLPQILCKAHTSTSRQRRTPSDSQRSKATSTSYKSLMSGGLCQRHMRHNSYTHRASSSKCERNSVLYASAACLYCKSFEAYRVLFVLRWRLAPVMLLHVLISCNHEQRICNSSTYPRIRIGPKHAGKLL